jgi:hypothetical protein
MFLEDIELDSIFLDWLILVPHDTINWGLGQKLVETLYFQEEYGQSSNG